jgi:hypothetical protein
VAAAEAAAIWVAGNWLAIDLLAVRLVSYWAGFDVTHCPAVTTTVFDAHDAASIADYDWATFAAGYQSHAFHVVGVACFMAVESRGRDRPVTPSP